MAREQWNYVTGYRGHYQVSDRGRIRSLKRQKPLIMKRGYTRTGYAIVNLCLDGKSQWFTVHSLVLNEFRGKRPAGKEACHNNGIMADCRLNNLRWDTKSNNAKDRCRHGKNNLGRGEDVVVGKLTEKKVLWIRRNRGKITQREMAKKFGVNRRNIWAAQNKKSWRHI